MATIWITGAKGFIGRNLAKFLADQGDIVFGVGHGVWQYEDARKWGVRGWIDGEIDALNLEQLMQVSGAPKVIYHLAGGASVGASFQEPYFDLLRTVESSARLLEWLRLNSPETSLVCASSAAVYGASHTGAISENAVIAPYSPYGMHKSMMENLCKSYAENFGLQVAIVRLFSVYGFGLEKQLIWDLCNKLVSEDGALILGGSGDELRDWLHVTDACSLLQLAGTLCDESCVAINGGTGIATSIRDIAETVVSVWGNGMDIEFSGVARSGDPYSLIADCSLVTQLGFNPQVILTEGLEDTVHRFRLRKNKL
ncbi:MAG: NAD-dependent epimerase/dehydratase family protein [Methylophaga sp.]|nr:NAD-dependent epimerase/dehydratase family protein [Methylophaga sp.]